MKKKNLIRFVESFILLPIITMSPSFGNLPQGAAIIAKATETPKAVLSQKLNIKGYDVLALNQAIDQTLEEKITAQKAASIDDYFEAHSMPLAGLGMKMVLEADKNGLDWRLLPAIAVRESTGGKFDCKKVENNPFGWGSCKIGFKSNEEAIEIVAMNLGGNNPKTAKHYDEKTTIQILRAYNPPSIVRRYAEQVISIMNIIGDADVEITSNTTT